MDTNYLHIINVLIGINTEYIKQRNIKSFRKTIILMTINFITTDVETGFFMQDRFVINRKNKIATGKFELSIKSLT